MFIIEKIKSATNGRLSVEFEFGKRYATLQEANQECIRTLQWYNEHSKKLNKTVGEYLVIVDSHYNYCNSWYLFNGEVDWIRANDLNEVQWFAYSMANA